MDEYSYNAYIHMISPEILRQNLKKATTQTIYARGLDYFRRGKVREWNADEDIENWVVTVEGKVKGSEMYEVVVSLDPMDGACFDLSCTCPYGEDCKHAVALGLAYADSLEQKISNIASAAPHKKVRIISSHAITPNFSGVENEEESRMREALKSLGIAAESVPAHLIEQLVSYQQNNKQPASEIIPLGSAHTHPLSPPFNAEDYFFTLNLYQQYTPRVHQKDNPYQEANITKILARDDITPAQRELLQYIKDGKFAQYQSPPPDPAKLFPLLIKSRFKVYSSYHSYNDRPLVIDIHPVALKAEIIYEPAPMYADTAKVRHDFFLRMPEEYWKNQDLWHENEISVHGDAIIRQLEYRIEFHQLTPPLARIIGRVKPFFDYDSPARKPKYHQARLTGDEVMQFDEIAADASRLLNLTAPLPEFKFENSEIKPVSAFMVDFDNDKQTLHIAPTIDYGNYQQDISESVYESRRTGRTTMQRRPPYEHPDAYIITVKEGVIRCAKADTKKEITFYKELIPKTEVFGFTKTLKCQKRGPKPLNEYFRTAWPALSKFAREKKYPIIFAKDALPLEQSSFHADFAADINVENNWLYFDVACYCADEKVTLEKLLAYLASGQPFWRKDDGTLVEISNREELERLARLLESFHARESGGFEGQLHHASELEYVMTSSPHYNAERAKSFSQFLDRVRSGKPVKSVRLPKKLEKILRPYQKSGIEWLYFLRSHRFAGVLADDMGLGKTIQTLAMIDLEKIKGKPSLVVCPKSLLYNWELEAGKFFPELRVFIYEGSPAERHTLRRNIKKYDLIVVGYGTLKKDVEFFATPKMKFNYAVLDEAQFIKNHATKNAQAVKRLNTDYRLALTGTPLENNVSELWSMYDFLMPGFLGNYERFSKHFHKPIMDYGNTEALIHLRHKVGSFMLRRTKGEVLAELPPKIEQASQCHLSPAQNILYQQILASVRGEVFAAVDKKGFKSAQIHILAGLMKLRQACNHPALLTKEKDWRQYESAKLDMCLELVEEIIEGKRKVLIFSQFTKMLDIVSAALKERGVAHLYLSGKTNNRQKLVKTFNTNPAIPVFLISLKAGGTGLNLTAADTVIVFDPWWNPSVENQAIDRAHRIGQTKTVNVYRLLTSGTIEEKIQALKQKKQQLFDAMVGVSGDMFKKLTWDDVRELFTE